MKATALELLITVKAYPNPSASMGEAACIAGVSRAGKFVRLYPVPFRDLEDGQRFGKYQWVRVSVSSPSNDSRPETLRPHSASLETISATLSTTDSWAARAEIVMPLRSPSMCDIQDAQRKSKASLGFFKPERVLDVEYEAEDPPQWTKRELDRLRQQDFFLSNEKRQLEKIPVGFYYRYRCAGCRNKEPHRMKIIDWELAELWRKTRRKYDESKSIEHIRKRFLDEMCAEDRDTHFFTGNMQAHPTTFLILGVYWPKKSLQQRLF